MIQYWLNRRKKKIIVIYTVHPLLKHIKPTNVLRNIEKCVYNFYGQQSGSSISTFAWQQEGPGYESVVLFVKSLHLPVLGGFSPGAPVSFRYQKTCMIWSLSLGAALWLPTALNRLGEIGRGLILFHVCKNDKEITSFIALTSQNLLLICITQLLKSYWL